MDDVKLCLRGGIWVKSYKIETLSRLEEMYSRLQDDESKTIFNAKLDLMIDGNRLQFWKNIKQKILLLEIDSSYKFYIRHYASNLCETVLYAV